MDVIYLFVAVLLIVVSVNRLWVSVLLYYDSSRFGQDGMNWMFVGLVLGVIGLVIWFIIRPSRYRYSTYYPYQAWSPPPAYAPSYPPGWTPAPYPYPVPLPPPPGYQPHYPKTFDPFGVTRAFVTFFSALLFATCMTMAVMMGLAIILDLDLLHLDPLLFSPAALVAATAIQDVTLVYFVHIQMFKPGYIKWSDIGLTREKFVPRALLGVLAGAGLFGLGLATDYLMQAAGLVSGSGDSGGFITASGGLLGYILLLVATVAIAPPSEELFFRGYMQSALVRKWGPAAGIIVSSLFFAAMHLEPSQFLSLFLAGVLLGILFRKFGLVTAISCHAMNNLLAVSLLFMFT